MICRICGITTYLEVRYTFAPQITDIACNECLGWACDSIKRKPTDNIIKVLTIR